MKPHHCLLWLASSLSLGCLVTTASAQVTPDSTLGAERSVVTPNVVIKGLPSSRIDGGALRGMNLFHSFLDFSVQSGRGVYFSNPIGVENILSRVTGSNPSQILGKLGVLGRANLFLLSPNGIVFGPNASLDVQGSFVASTASAIQLGNNGQFSATEPQNSTLLAVQPDALFLTALAKQRGNISNAGNLAVGAGKSLTLFGNTVSSTGTLKAPGGIVQVLGDRVALLNNALVDVSSSTGGGTVLIGGDYQGRGTIPTASETYIGPNATIKADALKTGNGGRIIVWSNQSTQVYGKLSARGGIQTGNGGLIETSSADFLNTAGIQVDASSTNGSNGTWLIDPRNVIIQDSGTTNGSFDDTGLFTPGGDDSVLTTAAIVDRLNKGTNVTISTGATGTQDGNITVQGAIAKTAGGTANLTLSAANNITVNAPISSSAPAGALNLKLTGDSDRNGAGNVEINQPISTQGGTITAYGSVPTGTLVTSGIRVNADLNSQGGAISLTGSSATDRGIYSTGSIRSGKGRIDLSGTSQGTGATARGIDVSTIDSGGGAIFLTGTSAEAEGIVNSGSIDSGGGAISMTGTSIGTGDAARGIAILGALNSQGGIINLTGSGSNSGIFNSASITSEKGDIMLTSNRPVILSSITGTDNLTIQPQTSNLDLVLGGTGTANTIYLNNAELSNLSSGFSGITIGAETSSGTITLASAISRTEPLTLRGSLDLKGFSLNSDSGLTLGDITGSGSPIVLTSTGNITTGSITNPGGSVSLTSTEAGVGFGTIDTSVFTGNGGSVLIEAKKGDITPRPGAGIFTWSGAGNGGNVTLNASGSVSFSSFADTSAYGRGNAGKINIQAQSLTLANGAGLSANIYNVGSAGDITINTAGKTSFSGSVLVTSNVENGGNGNGGTVKITAQALDVLDGAQIQTILRGEDQNGPAGKGQVGTIDIDVSGAVLVSGVNSQGDSRIASDVGSGSIGTTVPRETITIKAQSLTVEKGATIATTVYEGGNGTAGNIGILAKNLTVDNATIRSEINQTAIGQGGSINIQANSFSASGNALLSTLTDGQGSAGNVTISASKSIAMTDNAKILASTSTSGSAGNIRLSVNNGSLSLNDSALKSTTTGAGNAGDIELNASDTASLSNSEVSSTVGQTSTGLTGRIDINAGTIRLKNNTNLKADSSSPDSAAGQIYLRGLQTVSIQKSTVSSKSVNSASANGDFGVIQISAQRGSVSLDGATLTVQNTGLKNDPGTSGDIDINAHDRIDIKQSTISVKGNSGYLFVGPRPSNNYDDGFFPANYDGSPVVPAQTVDIDHSVLTATNEVIGGTFTAGDIGIRAAKKIFIRNSSTIDSTTSGEADGGIIQISAPSTVTLDQGSEIKAASTSTGIAGDLSIQTQALTIDNKSQTTASNTGEGEAGSLSIDAGTVLLDNGGKLTAESKSGSEGGDISLINLSSLRVQNNSLISASTVDGQGGSLKIKAPGGSVALNNGGILKAEATGKGAAGDVEVLTADLTAENNSEISASSQNGKGGDLTIKASDNLDLSRFSRIAAESIGTGNAGTLSLSAANINVDRGAEATVSSKSGDAGSLNITAANGLSITNSGKLTANTTSGNGGDINIRVGSPLQRDPDGEVSASAFFKRGIVGTSKYTLTLNNRGEISTSTGSGQAGSIFIQANNLIIKEGSTIKSTAESGTAGKIDIKLSNLLAGSYGKKIPGDNVDAIISASSEKGGDGQIDITAKYIFLTNSSAITSRVFDGTGGGGNITLQVGSQFIALQDSDILADAKFGDGGNIQIRPRPGDSNISFIADIFGPVQRNPGDIDRYRRNQQVNISASSQFGVSGTVTTPDFSFLQNNLTELASQLVSADRLIAGSCIARRNQTQGSFVVTGNGGLPTSPYDAIRSSYSAAGIQLLDGSPVARSIPPVSKKLNWQMGQPIQEAQGMTVTPDGRIVLGTSPELMQVQESWDLLCDSSKSSASPNKPIAANH